MKLVYENRDSRIDLQEVNQLARQPARFITDCEAAYETQLQELVRRMRERAHARILLLAGPSSSGKTTTAHKLAAYLEQAGAQAHVVSLDDFYLGMEFYPKLPDGTPDMESVDSLDLPLINETLSTLLQTGRALFPTFDFERSCRGEAQNLIELGENGVIVMEGLHALNPRLVEALPQDALYRAYVSTRTVYLDGEREVLTPKDARLIRRMVRDHKFRGRSPVDTLVGWKDVLDGEEKYIYPFRDSVDYRIDSAFDYEGCVFHHYILPMIEELKKETVYRGKVRQIVDLLEAFDDIDFRYIPKHSLLREFIGSDPGQAQA